MQEPLKVTLPPWRRGDGKPCKEPGWYAVKMNNPTGDGISEWCYKATDDVLHATNEYIGPVEYAVTEREPEILKLSLCNTYLSEEQGFWCCRQVDVTSEAILVLVRSLSKQAAIKANNAAVRAMEGK